ncbi:glycoside hydrolase superfamily [Cadophora sp. MPI-SDFR-AT-0126]|nr:glycoside hydrolase superfamily [Leotiomycetes sp. MPI-SDFR-AT-0126]
MKFLQSLLVAGLALRSAAFSIGDKNFVVKKDSDGLQNLVTYDEHSLIVRGERIFIFSGEFHAFRLPVPDLWVDVLQKIKAAGFSAVSFYTHWALLEGEQGVYRADGVFALEPLLEAASKVGIYLIARPGPYINAEASGGGFPGWLQRVKGALRSRAPDYLAATDNYISSIGKTIAKYQITNGGPVILLQPENEYSGSLLDPFPDPVYAAHLEKQYRDAGIVVPFISNDAWAAGHLAPVPDVNGSTLGAVDIYGFDSYPLGFDCANPHVWPNTSLPQTYYTDHQRVSPSTFLSINEFQGGAFDTWGGTGFDLCAALLNMEYERVFYKYVFAQGTTLLNIYMTYGGTNWGNLGYSQGYTSYDYGAAITENRGVSREKYSQTKLLGYFLKVSPAILTTSVGVPNNSFASTAAITANPLYGNGTKTNFYLVRATDETQDTPISYTFTVPTSKGQVTIPQLGGTLTLPGRDAKWLVTDYSIGNATLLYSSAEIFTWKQVGSKTFLVVYGGAGEQHELALVSTSSAETIEGSGVTAKTNNSTTILGWKTSSTRRVVQVGDVIIYVLDRNTAYNFWVPDFKRSDSWGAYTTTVEKTTSVIIEAGYLVRDVTLDGSALKITGDLNATAPLKVIGAPKSATQLFFNGMKLSFKTNSVTGEWASSLEYNSPAVKLPDLSSLKWKYIDSLPEIQASYDDSKWTVADKKTTNNPTALATPTSLYASDYGYNTGALIYRGHFTATGKETTLNLTTQGGNAYGTSVWLGNTYLGSLTGNYPTYIHADIYTLPSLKAGQKYIITAVIDNNGLNENWWVGGEDMKAPRGIMNYTLTGHPQTAITWKLTGNLNGEKYIDKARGPLNEGGLFAERQGYHLPSPPSQDWASGSPLTGTKTAGIAFYTTSFKLDLPAGYDIPLTFNFGNTTMDGTTANYEALLWVNGWQFGKYINNLGPQLEFPVPQGILDYSGTNWVAVGIWARQSNGARLAKFTLEAGTPVLTALKAPRTADAPKWKKRAGAY